ncbi:MAG: PhoH-like ATPase [Campylobacterota bacterium]|nr:PhoH-like ATPase [Campylobacterota bacterium]
MKKAYLLDTSVVIDSIENIKNLSEDGKNIIVITDIVLNETDHLKNSFGTVGYMARRFNNFLQDAEVLNIEKFEHHTITRVKNKNIEIDLISQEIYKENFSNNYQSVVNDRRIIETALWADKFYDELLVVSNDVAFRTFAIAKGLKTDSLKVVESDLLDLNFAMDIAVDYDYAQKLNYLDVETLEKELKINIPKHCINLVFKQKMSDHFILANIINNKIEILDENKLRDCKLPPKNKEQLFYANLIKNPAIDIVISSSPSGSGKTAVAMAMAIKLIDDPNRDFQKIVYIRNPIDSVDKDAYIGFKKGDMEDKMGGFFTPIYDALESFAIAELKKSKKELNNDNITLKVEEYIKRYNITFPYIGNLRGSNLSNSVIIIDEAQNFSLSSMQLVLTRVTDGSKVVVIGDINQVDSIYLSKLNNALTFLLNEAKKENCEVRIGAITMPKSIRGKICAWSEEVFSRHK